VSNKVNSWQLIKELEELNSAMGKELDFIYILEQIVSYKEVIDQSAIRLMSTPQNEIYSIQNWCAAKLEELRQFLKNLSPERKFRSIENLQNAIQERKKEFTGAQEKLLNNTIFNFDEFNDIHETLIQGGYAHSDLIKFVYLADKLLTSIESILDMLDIVLVTVDSVYDKRNFHFFALSILIWNFSQLA
jgi:hypothetical protein